MERLTKFGYVWKHKKTGKLHGAKIDVKDTAELREYEQVSRKNDESAPIKNKPKGNENA